MKLRLATPEQLVDISWIANLNYIRQQGDVVRMDATTTHYQVQSSALLRACCPLLAETADHIGDIQVRNRGTIGGSVSRSKLARFWSVRNLSARSR
jgi:carbon-monoxide dehydrogenase medium subunit